MKRIGILLFFPVFNLLSNSCFGQCQPDSIVSYRIVNNEVHLASVEYFKYDSNDSLIKTWLTNFDDTNKPTPSYQIDVNRTKSKGEISVTFKTELWNEKRAVYSPSSKEIQTKNKKGQLLRIEILDYKSVNSKVDYYNVKRIEYSYNKQGKLIEEITLTWDTLTNNWSNTNKKLITYNLNNTETETVLFGWNTENQIWTNEWKHNFEYDSVNQLTQTITYQSLSNVWVPYSKTDYGKDSLSPIKWQHMQVWSGEKNAWLNKAQYVFQIDSAGLTDVEIHLAWSKDEWKIDFAVFYKYNEAGDLVKIVNDAEQVIWERFCRTP